MHLQFKSIFSSFSTKSFKYLWKCLPKLYRVQIYGWDFQNGSTKISLPCFLLVLRWIINCLMSWKSYEIGIGYHINTNYFSSVLEPAVSHSKIWMKIALTINILFRSFSMARKPRKGNSQLLFICGLRRKRWNMEQYSKNKNTEIAIHILILTFSRRKSGQGNL